MNRDYLKRFPSQLIEQRPTECVGETVADIIGNIERIPCDAGFSYAAALRIAGQIPTTAGSDPYSGMLSSVVYGALPTENEPFDAATTSELYEANIANYGASGLLLAKNFTQPGVLQFYSYSGISNYLSTYNMGVQLGLRWYESFNTPNQDGTLPPPSGQFTEHCVAVYEDTDKGLRIKPWLGPSYGDGGYAYLSEASFNLVFQDASGFDQNAYRWTSLVKILLPRWYLFSDVWPQLKPGS